MFYLQGFIEDNLFSHFILAWKLYY